MSTILINKKYKWLVSWCITVDSILATVFYCPYENYVLPFTSLLKSMYTFYINSAHNSKKLQNFDPPILTLHCRTLPNGTCSTVHSECLPLQKASCKECRSLKR